MLLSEGNLCKCHLVARVAQSHSFNYQGSFVATARLRDDPTSRVQLEGRPGRAVDGSRLTALWGKKKPNGVTSQDPSGSERSPAQEEVDRQDVHRGKVTLLPIGGSGARKTYLGHGSASEARLISPRLARSHCFLFHFTLCDSRRKGHGGILPCFTCIGWWCGLLCNGGWGHLGTLTVGGTMSWFRDAVVARVRAVVVASLILKLVMTHWGYTVFFKKILALTLSVSC